MKKLIIAFLISLCSWLSVGAYGYTPAINIPRTGFITGVSTIPINITYSENSNIFIFEIRNENAPSSYTITFSFINGNNVFNCSLGSGNGTAWELVLGNTEPTTEFYTPGGCTLTTSNPRYGGLTSITIAGGGTYTYQIDTFGPPPVDGSCGSRATSYDYTDTSYPAGTFCSAGTALPSSPAFPTAGGTTTWSCQGSNGGSTTSCTATRDMPPLPVNGACGTNQGYLDYETTSYSGTFCSSGTASPSSPAFPDQGGSTSWICTGSNGGTDSGTCIASRGTAPAPVVNGACGSRSTSYAYDVTSYPAGTFCSSGTASPGSPAFPAQGANINWICNGSGGGTNASCSASRGTAPVVYPVCGTNAKAYNSSDTSYAGTFCASGTASPSSPSFPAQGGSTSWNCVGTGQYTSCTATRAAEESTGNWISSIAQFFSGLITAVSEFTEEFGNIFVFKFEWLGFNINALNFSNFWEIDWDFVGRVTPAKANIPGKSETNICNGYGFYMGRGWDNKANNVYVNVFIGYGPGGHPIPTPIQRKYFYDNALTLYTYGVGNYSNERPLYIKLFPYINKNIGNNKLVKMNVLNVSGINIIPFNITIFNIAITEIIDTFILYMEQWILSLLSTPMNALAELYNNMYIIGIRFEPDTEYCFFGSVWKMQKTYYQEVPSYMRGNGQPLTNSIAVGVQLVSLFICLMFTPIIWRKWVRFLSSNI